jgi:hypothetical protein
MIKKFFAPRNSLDFGEIFLCGCAKNSANFFGSTVICAGQVQPKKEAVQGRARQRLHAEITRILMRLPWV